MHRYNESNSENLVKSGKRGQITDQLVEIPLEHQVYDMINAEGQKGITILELSDRLGINLKMLCKRAISMREKYGVVSQTEMHNKQQMYRFFTSMPFRNPSLSVSDDQNLLLEGNELFTQTSDPAPYYSPLDSNSKRELIIFEKTDSVQESKIHSSSCEPSSEVINYEQDPVGVIFTDSILKFDEASSAPESHILVSTSLQPISTSAMSVQKSQKYACRASPAFALQREQRIIEKLKSDKFLLKVELHKWLEDIENKPTQMDRKTLDRSLKKLQDAGFCKCVGLHMPSTSNFSSLRHTEAVLHPSVTPSPELMRQIYDRQRSFDTQNRRCSMSARLKPEKPVVELPQPKQVNRRRRSSKSVHDISATKKLNENGFVMAKMVRVKLLHKFLWSYLSNSPCWKNTARFWRKDSIDVMNSGEDWQLFSLDAAIKEMPLDLFLQIAGSNSSISNLEKKCKLGLKLSDLPIQDRRCLLDSNATSRLSAIVETLLRLRLIQLVNKGAVQAVNMLTHVLELQPYLEEPVPVILPCSNIKSTDHCYKIRHDFIFSNKEAVDRYWETLEYSFAAADPVYSRQCFPGSTVEEVYHRRSWCSVRVMTTEQRVDLLKRIKSNDQTEKIPMSECMQISRDLNLTLEQVLRVYYDKQQARGTEHCNSLNFEGWGQNESTNIVADVPRKKRRILTHGDQTQNMLAGELIGSTERTSDIDEELVPLDSSSLSTERFREQSPDEVQLQPHAETLAFVAQCALDELKPTHKRGFAWTDNSDRKLIMHYARQRAKLGPRFVRVEWHSLLDLPAQPTTCKRRLAYLNKKPNIRSAVLRLCKLLGERYTHFMSIKSDNQKSFLDDDFHRKDEGAISQAAVDNAQHYCWDDFEDSILKMALDDVLKNKRLAKIDESKKIDCVNEKGWTNNSLSDDLPCISHDMENCNASSRAGGVLPDSTQKDADKKIATSSNVQNASNNYLSHENSLKLNGKSSINSIYRSSSIANAIELLKLVFLSCSKDPKVQNLLALTLRKYSQDDIFAAFCYLREKNYLVIGNGSRPFVLSKKFFHNISTSPFSNDSGKRADNFSSWLMKQQNDLIQNGVAVPPDLQCGEIFHLFSLVFSGEISISPRLPNCSVVEDDELQITESFSLLKNKEDDVSTSKKSKRSCDVPCNPKKLKKSKPQGKADCERREKGFPGIKVFVNLESGFGTEDFECLGSEKLDSYELVGDSTSFKESNCLEFFVDKIDMHHNVHQSYWDEMPKYLNFLTSNSDIICEARPSSMDFKYAHSIICQAGEQGLSIDEISAALKLKGEKVAKMIVETLEVFKMAVKVNAFNSVRVVDASYASKYFISTPMCVKSQSQDYDILSCTRPQDMGSDLKQHSNNANKTLFQNASYNSCENYFQRKPLGECTMIAEESKNEEYFQGQENVDDNARNTVARMASELWPIFPWINGDGSINMNVYNGLARRIFGIVMQNPCILEEDLIAKMDALNPQSCRRLLETMVLDNHIMLKCVHQAAIPALPTILQSLLSSNFRRPSLKLQKHYLANPMSTRML